MIFWRVLSAAFWIVLATSYQGNQGAWAEEVDYRLGAGDRLRVTVFGHDDLSGEFEVGASGAISVPLIGDVAVGGRSVAQTEQAIIAALKPDYLKNPRVSIDVLNYRPFYILGEVRAPGSYAYVSGMRVINAIALAGGYTYRAKESGVTITRGGAAGDTGTGQKIATVPGTPVLPGDIVEVPERFF